MFRFAAVRFDTKAGGVMRATPLSVLVLALGVSVSAAAQDSASARAYASAQNVASPQGSASARNNPSQQSNAPPTPAQLDQPGAVVIPPPILRNSGRTVMSRDEPLLGRLNLQGQTPGLVREPPPAMPSPSEAATSVGAGIAGARGEIRD
jgi:hypothetical protein